MNDVCYECGKVQDYGTMQDVSPTKFDILCDDCSLDIGKSYPRNHYLEMSREYMINKLVDDDILTIRKAMAYDDYDYLDTILRCFVGYQKQTQDELISEFSERDFRETWNYDLL
jgi:hypothetical protein